MLAFYLQSYNALPIQYHSLLSAFEEFLSPREEDQVQEGLGEQKSMRCHGFSISWFRLSRRTLLTRIIKNANLGHLLILYQREIYQSLSSR